MLSATVNAANSAQNCQNLPKDEALKYHQKSNFYCFSEIKISMYRGAIRACFHHLDFQSKNFSYAIYCQKTAFVCEFQAYPLVEIDDFLKVPHLV
jgi:hypothetical protein